MSRITLSLHSEVAKLGYKGGPGGGAPGLQVHGVQGGSGGLPPVW